MRTTVRTRLLAITAALALAACGGAADDGGGEAGRDDPTITATDLAFEPTDLSLPAGTTDLTLVNEGAAEHDVTVDELGLEVYAAPGETTTESVDLEAGSYTFYCSIPGHREAGMEGTLTVES